MSLSGLSGNLQLGAEYPIPNEQEYTRKIAERFKRELGKYYQPGNTKRMFHPKMHGLVQAEFHVEPELPASLQVGLFQPGAVYPAWIRFSNAKRHPAPDRKPDMRGMAIKLIGVEGEKCMDPEDAITHDFVLVTSPTLQTKSVKDFQKAIYALTGGFWALFFFAITHIGTMIRSIKQISKCSNVLEQTYFSSTPYRYGNAPSAVKYKAAPVKKNTSPFPAKPTENYLRAQLKLDLSAGDTWFNFYIQQQEDPKLQPIEDPRKEWETPFTRIASIKIPKQQFDSPAQNNFGENLSFNPWRCLEAHLPLGGANRARKAVYETIATYRHQQNDAPAEEPNSIKSFNL